MTNYSIDEYSKTFYSIISPNIKWENVDETTQKDINKAVAAVLEKAGVSLPDEWRKGVEAQKKIFARRDDFEGVCLEAEKEIYSIVRNIRLRESVGKHKHTFTKIDYETIIAYAEFVTRDSFKAVGYDNYDGPITAFTLMAEFTASTSDEAWPTSPNRTNWWSLAQLAATALRRGGFNE